uniref:Retinoblastoma-associated protein N-terminal domain-containing protein n=1 Tax=Ditylenchus dipsaci TaxID=166011 RepID=A0A915D7P7_9BILA
MESFEQFSSLLRELDDVIDDVIEDGLLEKSWQHYESIAQQIILEGDQKSWMACAFYVTVWQATPVRAQEPVFKYSILKLLTICNLSVLEFLEKLNRWAEMTLAKPKMLEHISLLEDDLALSTFVYKKFLKIFRYIFKNPTISSPTKSQGSSMLDVCQIFKLTWITFLSLKNMLAIAEADLLDGLNLLFCVLESMLTDIRDLKITELMISPVFVASVEDSVTPLASICKFFEMPLLDAKHFQQYRFLPKIQGLVLDGVVQGTALLRCYRSSRAALESVYEENMLNRLEIDQRILIAGVGVEKIFDESRDASILDKSVEVVDLSENSIAKSAPKVYVDTQIYIEEQQQPEGSTSQQPVINPYQSGHYNLFAEENSSLDRFGVKRKHEMIL